MANNIDWGQGAVNNNIGWGQGASSNSISWGISQKDSYSGETEIYGIRADADSIAFYSKVTAAGGTLTATEQAAVNQLVVDLKAKGLWTSMKAIYPMVGSSAAACAQNLKSSSFTGTFAGGWTFASTGATPNGTNAYMNTTLTPSISSTQDSTHYSFYSRTNNSLAQTEMGIVGINPYRWNLELRYLGTLSSDQYNYTTNRITGANTNSLGYYIATRTNNTTHKIFKNNVQFSTTNTTTSSLISFINAPVYIGTANNGGNVFSSKQCAFASIGDGLTNTQAADFYTSVQAFQTTLSRQV